MLRHWFGNTSDVPYKTCAGEMLSSLRADVDQGGPKAAQRGILEATLEPLHHPICLGVVDGSWLVLDL